MSNESLLNRFCNFLNAQAGAECIDSLTLTTEQAAAKHADYFLQDRHVIVEIKSLETDTGARMNPILAPHLERPEFHKLDSLGIDAVLDMISDGDALRDTLYASITDSVEGAVEKANRQIRETKRTFNLPDAYGLFVLLNDTVLILDPKKVGKRVAESLMKRTDNDEKRFTEIDAAWLLNERHVVDLGGRRGKVDLILPCPDNERSKYASGLADLLT